MPTPTDAMIAALDAFVADDEYDENQFRLYSVTKGFRDLPDNERVVPHMFALIERFPDAYLGTPGPLVHSIESLGVARYEEQLIGSVRRQPAELSVWMINRILNVESDQTRRDMWLELLRSASCHPVATARVVESANGFLEHQAARGAG